MNKVPNLRFKEFSEEWKTKCLEELFSFKNGLNKEKEFFGKGSPIVNFTDVYKNRGLKSQDIKGLVEVTEKELINYNVSKGDVFFTRTSETIDDIGMSSVILDEVENTVFSGFVLRARPKNNTLSDEFKKYCFSTFNARKEIVTKSSFTTRALTSGTLLNGVEINYPSLEEQEKIASFFSLIDKKIELQTEKVEELKKYKKGIMQKIFSGELRFKDENGNEFPEWMEYKVKDLFDVTRGVVIAKNEISEKSDEVFKYAVYSSQTSNNGILGYDQTFDFDGNYLTWTTDGANAGRVFCRSGRFRCTNVCGVLVEKDNTIGYANKLVAEILNKETPRHVSYVGNPKLMNGVMAEIKLSIPSLQEQIKIDRLINQIDMKIENEEIKLNLLVDYKKGLLQQMFV